MTETYHVRGKFTNAGDTSTVLKPRKLAARDNDGKIAVTLSKDWAGAILLQKSTSENGAWITLATYTFGGPQREVDLEADTVYRLYCSTLSNGSASYQLGAFCHSDYVEGNAGGWIGAMVRRLATPGGLEAIGATKLGKANVFNYSPTALPKYRAALANAMFNGGPRVKIAVWAHDSTGVGAGAGSGGTNNINGAFAYSMPSALARLLTGYLSSMGFSNAVSTDTQFNDNAVPGSGVAGITSYNPKITFEGSATWTRNNRYLTNSTTTDKIIYTPALSSDTITVGYYTTPSRGPMAIYDNGVQSGANITNDGTTRMLEASRTRTASTNPWGVARVSGGSVIVQYLDCYHSTNTKISIMNMARYGATSTNFATDLTADYGYLVNLDVWLPHLTIIGIGINDVNTSVDPATYRANLYTLVAKAQSVGSDVIFMRFHPISITGVSDATFAQYEAAQYSVAAECNIPLVDNWKRFGSYTAANALGNYSDTLHLTAQGYGDVAMGLWDLVRPQ